MSETKTLVFKNWKTKTVATLVAIVAAVAIPQILHLIGAASGLGSALGEIFLPMHIAIFMVGLLAGPVAGVVAGALSPAISFALTGMPAVAMLPYMVIELAVYGLVTGLLASVKMPTIVKLLIAQIAGRGIRAIAIVIGFYAFSSPIGVAVIWNSILTGLVGLVLQWVLVPLTMFWIEAKAKKDE